MHERHRKDGKDGQNVVNMQGTDEAVTEFNKDAKKIIGTGWMDGWIQSVGDMQVINKHPL